MGQHAPLRRFYHIRPESTYIPHTNPLYTLNRGQTTPHFSGEAESCLLTLSYITRTQHAIIRGQHNDG